MRHHLLAFSIIIFFISCEKSSEYLIPESEVPEWLKTRIAQDIKTLESDPRSSLRISAWMRTEFEGEYYYEFINLLSSAEPMTYKSDGTKFIYTDNGFMDYQSGKCCKKYVWKGPDYQDN